MSKEAKKPVKLDLEMCYSGFNLEELQYIDYTRSTVEDESEDQLDFLPEKSDGHDLETELLSATFDECTTNYSKGDLRSYLCSTPTLPRPLRESSCIPKEVDLSEIQDPDPEYASHFGKFEGGALPRSDSLVSVFGERRVRTLPGSVESLNFSEVNGGGSMEGPRRKIELNSDLQDPYSNLDDLDLSIEEDFGDEIGTMGTLRRRLSLKVFRRKPSIGLFDSYRLKNRGGESLLSSKENVRGQANNGGPNATPHSNSSRPQGPLNFWFRKFRNRHFI